MQQIMVPLLMKYYLNPDTPPLLKTPMKTPLIQVENTANEVIYRTENADVDHLLHLLVKCRCRAALQGCKTQQKAPPPC